MMKLETRQLSRHRADEAAAHKSYWHWTAWAGTGNWFHSAWAASFESQLYLKWMRHCCWCWYQIDDAVTSMFEIFKSIGGDLAVTSIIETAPLQLKQLEYIYYFSY